MDPRHRTDMDLIIPGLYLGSARDASNLEGLTAAGVTHILTVASGINPAFPRQFTYLVIPVSDSSDANLRKHFFTCRKFIRKCLEKNEAVLVHCLMGISRSASIVIAYMMMESNICYYDAYNLVKSLRDRISPNIGFIRQLQQLDQDLSSQRT